MKPVTKLIPVLATAALALAPSVRAEAPEEAGIREKTGNAGESVDLRGRPALRDLVDNTVCRWREGADVARSLTHYPRVISAIESGHWYLANLIEREGAELRFCFTTQLKKIPTEDEEAVTIAKVKGKQAAIRIDYTVYVDDGIFRKMDAVNQAYLFLHEVGHSFIGQDVPRRNLLLRSFVSMVREHEKKPMTAEEFKYQVGMNQISVPGNTEVLEGLKPLLLGVVGEAAATREAQELQNELRRRSPRTCSRCTYRGLTEADGRLLEAGVSSFQRPLVTAMSRNDHAGVAAALASGISANAVVERTVSARTLRPRGYGHYDAYYSRTGDSLTFEEMPALLYATLRGDAETVKLLLQGWDAGLDEMPVIRGSRRGGGSYNIRIRIQALHVAAALGHTAIVEQLIKTPGVDVNAPDENGMTALHYAADQARVGALKALLGAQGIDVNARSRGFDTPLTAMLYSCRKVGIWPELEQDFLRAFKVLLSSPSVDLLARDESGREPLQIASAGYCSTAEALIKNRLNAGVKK